MQLSHTLVWPQANVHDPLAHTHAVCIVVWWIGFGSRVLSVMTSAFKCVMLLSNGHGPLAHQDRLQGMFVDTQTNGGW